MNEREVLNLVRRVVNEMAEQGELPNAVAGLSIGYETPISALGADSLAKAAILAALADYTERPLSEDVLVGEATIGDLLRAAGLR